MGGQLPRQQSCCRHNRISSHRQSSWQNLSQILGIVRQAFGVWSSGEEQGRLTLIAKGYIDTNREGWSREKQCEDCDGGKESRHDVGVVGKECCSISGGVWARASLRTRVREERFVCIRDGSPSTPYDRVAIAGGRRRFDNERLNSRCFDDEREASCCRTVGEFLTGDGTEALG
jgi:hypothetical protein